MAVPLGIAAYSCSCKAKKAKKEGNIEEAERLMNNCEVLTKISGVPILAAGVILGPAAGIITYGILK